MNIIDHLGLQVSDYSRALRFYRQALAPLGISVVMQVTKEETGSYEGAGLGRDGKPSFWIGAGEQNRAARSMSPSSPTAAPRSIASSRRRLPPAASTTARRASARITIPNYYGAFVLDPDGHNIEAVCHAPE